VSAAQELLLGTAPAHLCPTMCYVHFFMQIGNSACMVDELAYHYTNIRAAASLLESQAATGSLELA
jgi:hypothetical protein